MKWLKRMFIGKGPLFYISGIAGVLAIINTFVTWVEDVPDWAFASAFWFLVVCIVSFLVHEGHMRRSRESDLETSRSKLKEEQRNIIELKKQLDIRKKSYALSHTVAHDVRDFLFESEMESWEPEVFKIKLSTLLEGILVDTSKACTELTGARVNSCIKLFIDKKDEHGYEFLRTFCRDRVSRRERQRNDREDVKVNDNTDFLHIMNTDETFFLENNLPEKEKKGKYHNQHKDYQDYYRSTVVLSIERTALHSELQNFHDILGFFCVDSFATDIFDQNEIKDFLAVVSDNIYLPINRYQQIVSPTT